MKTSKAKKTILGVTKDDGKNKPAVFKLFDFAKGGTDIVDQRMGTIQQSWNPENGPE